MNIKLTFILILLLVSTAQAVEPILLVDNGVAKNVFVDKSIWGTKKGFLVGKGRVYLQANVGIGAGPFVVTAQLKMERQRASAAGLALGNGFFGFEGAKAEEIFLNGKSFGGYRSLGRSTKVFNRGGLVTLKVTRDKKNVIRFAINDRTISSLSFAGKMNRLAFTPWRSSMSIRQWTVSGNTFKVAAPPRPKSPGYSIPLIDLATQTQRQVIVDREPGQYLGHPTTVLLEDGKTMICVYPKGHGRGPIVMKRSRDAGKTWSKRLAVPKNWASSKETPTIHRVIDRQGKKRLILFSGLYPIRMSVSQNDGETWTPLKSIGDFGGIVTMSSVERLKDGRYMALFHDDGRFIAGRGRAGPFFVYKTISKDGGLTWSKQSVIASHSVAHLCEPGLIRSPDGKQIAVLLRENSRRLNSFVIFSNDEGATWTKPVQLPGSLTGDRHVGKFARDGRLFISFRDQTHVSRTKGDWVGWVGRYEDIVKGREGQYRVRLMDNHRGGDCAYPGVEILADGTFVTTTYGHWIRGKSPYIVSVRFKLSELDALARRNP